MTPREKRASAELKGERGLVRPRTLNLREVGMGRERVEVGMRRVLG